MAQSRFIEFKDKESWISISRQFGDWLKTSKMGDGIGWSEGNQLILNDSIKFYCFDFPDRHLEKIGLFEEWAKSTGRLYGIAEGRKVRFPNNPKLDFILPPNKPSELPPWLRQ